MTHDGTIHSKFETNADNLEAGSAHQCAANCLEEVMSSTNKKPSDAQSGKEPEVSKEVQEAANKAESILCNSSDVRDAASSDELGNILLAAHKAGNLDQVTEQINKHLNNAETSYTLKTFQDDVFGEDKQVLGASISKREKVDNLQVKLGDFSLGDPLNENELEEAADRISSLVLRDGKIGSNSDRSNALLSLQRAKENGHFKLLLDTMNEDRFGDSAWGPHWTFSSKENGVDRRNRPITELTLNQVSYAEGTWEIKK